MRVGNFGGFLFGGCNNNIIDHQTAKFSGYTVAIYTLHSPMQALPTHGCRYNFYVVGGGGGGACVATPNFVTTPTYY